MAVVTIVSGTGRVERITLGDKIRPLDRMAADWSEVRGGVGEVEVEVEAVGKDV